MNLDRERPGNWPRVYICHVPKTGGTSLLSWIRRIYPPGTVLPAALLDDLVSFTADQLSGYRCFAGHFSTALETVIPPLSTITILRNPVEHALSQLKYLYRLPGNLSPIYHGRLAFILQKAKENQGDLEPCLQVPEFREHLRNPQSRFLTHPFQLAWYLGRPAQEWRSHLWDVFDHTPDDNALLKQAQNKLDGMTGVGIYERFEDSADLLMYRLGLPSPEKWPQKNVSPERQNNIQKTHLNASIRPEILEDLNSLLQCDLALYQYACSRLERDLAHTEGFPGKLVRWNKIPTTLSERSSKKVNWKKQLKKLVSCFKFFV